MTWGCSTRGGPFRQQQDRTAPAGSELYRDRERAQALHYVQPHSLPCLVPDGRSDGLSHLAAHGQADGICRHVGSVRLTEAEGRLVLLRAGATVPHCCLIGRALSVQAVGRTNLMALLSERE